MKKLLIALLVSLGLVSIAYAAPTSTVVQNLFINALKSTPTAGLTVGANGLVATGTVSSGGGSTTTINQLFNASNTFNFVGANGFTIATSSTSTITFTQGAAAGGSSTLVTGVDPIVVTQNGVNATATFSNATVKFLANASITASNPIVWSGANNISLVSSTASGTLLIGNGSSTWTVAFPTSTAPLSLTYASGSLAFACAGCISNASITATAPILWSAGNVISWGGLTTSSNLTGGQWVIANSANQIYSTSSQPALTFFATTSTITVSNPSATGTVLIGFSNPGYITTSTVATAFSPLSISTTGTILFTNPGYITTSTWFVNASSNIAVFNSGGSSTVAVVSSPTFVNLTATGLLATNVSTTNLTASGSIQFLLAPVDAGGNKFVTSTSGGTTITFLANGFNFVTTSTINFSAGSNITITTSTAGTYAIAASAGTGFTDANASSGIAVSTTTSKISIQNVGVTSLGNATGSIAVGAYLSGGATLNVSSTLASSTINFTISAPTTTAPSYTMATWDYQRLFTKIGCVDANGTTTLEIENTTVITTTTINSYLTRSLICGVGGGSTSTFTSSTLPANFAVLWNVTSTTGSATDSVRVYNITTKQ